MANQLYIKEHSDKKNIFPKNYTDNIRDKESNKTLTEILQGFNCYFLSYTGNVETTRLQVPKLLRKQGLWITYVDYENNTITEYYDNPSIEDSKFKDSSNWRKGNNTLVGDLSISANGNWVIDNKETEFKAQGEAGATPLIRFSNNKFQISYNEGKYWENITGDVTNQLKISKYIGADESLPTSGIAEGTIYMKGPFYKDDDTLLEYPSYRMYIYAWKDNTLAWQDNGEFTSVIVGVVNDLTTGGADKALSAEMGKELGYREYNPEYARAYVDADGRFLWGIKLDGSIEFAKGVPTPIKKYIESIDRDNDEEIARINQLVAGLITDVNVLTDTYHYISNSEWACAIMDTEGHILMGIKTDGSFYVPNRDMYYVTRNSEYAKVVVDAKGYVLFGIKSDGTCYIPKGISKDAKKGLTELSARISYFESIFSSIDNPEWAQVTTDKEGRIIEGVLKDGKKYFPKQDMLEKYNDIEGRLELTLDKDNNILSCRRKDGTKYEAKLHVGNHLSLGKGAMSDLQRDLRASGFNVDNPVDWSNESSISLPIPRYCAKVNIISKTGLATTKTQNKICVLEYWDKSGNYFKKYIILNAQGSSSMAYSEKNQGIDVFNDEACEESCDITFGNWVTQDSFHLKCYYIDVFRGIANVCYNYCEEAIQHLNSRNNRIPLNQESISYSNSTGDFDVDFGDGALCHPDGFPFEMYVNGEYYGLFAWNLKKHRKNYSMSKSDYTSALLDGVLDEVTFFNGNIDWTIFELRNPKDLVTMDGREYDADTNCNELIDETSAYYDANNKVHVNTAKIKEVVKRQASAIPLIVAEQDKDAARRIYEQYYDVEAMICFFIISNVIYNYDGFRKNWIWTIYNTIAAPSFYDLDTVFGRDWRGTNVLSNSISNILGTTENIPTGQLVRLYKSELDSTYKNLRDSNIISVSHIISYVNDWIKRVGLEAYKRNIDAWPSIPSYRVEKTENDGTYDGGMFDSQKRIEIWLSNRIEALDNYFNYN